MKKTIIIFLIILVSLFVVLTFLGRKDSYSKEKVLLKINQAVVKIAKDPAAAPAASYDRAIDAYKKFIKSNPGSPLLPMANVLLGKVYYLRKDYPRALESFQYSVDTYPSVTAVALQALVEIGKIYELTDQFDKIMENHDRVIREYPLTTLGLQTPIIKAKAYTKKENVAEATNAYNEAIVHYQKIIDEYPNTIAGFESMRYLAVCYIQRGKREMALSTLADLLNKSARTAYLNQQTAIVILKSINAIGMSDMNYLNKSLAIYKNFMEKYPEHPLNASLEKVIVRLEEVKMEASSAQAISGAK